IPINSLHNGKSEGVLIADIRLKEIWNLVARIRPGIKGESYIVDIENRVVAHRNPSVVLRETYFDPPNFNGIYRGLNEEKAVIVRKTISFGDQRLHIIVENPVAEAFALAFETIWVIVVALVTLSIFAAWLGVLAVRKIVFPVQNLAEIARQIQAGQLTKQANISTKDEIGELAEAFNSMTRQLTESMINMEKEVSERKRAETALKESEEKYRVLFQTFPLGISITDRDGNVIEVNATAESLLDLPQEMHVQENYSREAWNIIRPDGTPMPVEEFAGVRAKRENRTIKNLEMGYVKPQGDITWLSVTAAPIPLEKYGEAITYVNISKRKRVERELEKYRNHLEHLVKERTLELQIAQDELLKREKLAVLGQLTATVSHELRNPLGVIRTSTYYLQRRIKDRNEKIDKHLLRIDEQVGICDRLVEDLLEYTRGKVSDRIKCDINALVEEALNQMSISREVKVVRKLAMELPLVLMDPDKMRRVMINLIQNAVIAVTERKKTVSEEEKSNSYEPTLHVTTSSNSKAISIEITDNGIGMDKETAEKAFDPLFTTRARGTGLGLAIVKKILEEHGGTVSLESKLSQGTKIKFNLPIKSPKNHNITN
ncbi:MAG: ATP-binding protein, partial [Desulfobacteraceae bacterium]